MTSGVIISLQRSGVDTLLTTKESFFFNLFHKAQNILFFFQKSFQMFIVPCAFIFIIFHQTNYKNHKGNYSYSIILKYRSVIQENHKEIQRYKKIIEKYRDTRKS